MLLSPDKRFGISPSGRSGVCICGRHSRLARGAARGACNCIRRARAGRRHRSSGAVTSLTRCERSYSCKNIDGIRVRPTRNGQTEEKSAYAFQREPLSSTYTSATLLLTQKGSLNVNNCSHSAVIDLSLEVEYSRCRC